MPEAGGGRPASGKGRDVAFEVRVQVERGRRLDRAFDELAVGLDPRERAFARELAYGTTRMRGRLDHLLAARVRDGLESVRPDVLEILRLGAYQLLSMDSVPQYAAVSESVSRAADRGGKGVAGLVNAVLRRVADAGAEPSLFPDPDQDPEGFLSTWGSHPRWLVTRWIERWGVERTREIVEADNRRPPIYLVLLDGDEKVGRAALEAAGIESYPVPGVPGAVRLGEGASPRAALETVPHSIVQDPAARLVVLHAAVPPGMKVADLCAAPGGKAIALSVGSAYTLAADRSESRLRMIRENVERTGTRLDCVVADAEHPPVTAFDVVLVDAPCTGTGTLTRHPDARWRLRPESVDEMAVVQRRILHGATAAVAPGGLLVYSTCTLEREENEGVVEEFLAEHPDFELEGAPEAMLTLHPSPDGFDGAFAARMRRAR